MPRHSSGVEIIHIAGFGPASSLKFSPHHGRFSRVLRRLDPGFSLGGWAAGLLGCTLTMHDVLQRSSTWAEPNARSIEFVHSQFSASPPFTGPVLRCYRKNGYVITSWVT